MPSSTRSLEQRRSHIQSDTRIGLTIGNLISITGVIAVCVIGWQKIPSIEDVKDIARDSASQAMVTSQAGNKKIESRLKKVEDRSLEVQHELSGMNKRMDNMLILVAGSVAEDMHDSTRSRQAAETVRRNLSKGAEPFEGLPWRK